MVDRPGLSFLYRLKQKSGPELRPDVPSGNLLVESVNNYIDRVCVMV